MTTSDEQFREAMLAYDAEGRHSEGIRAVIALVRSQVKAQLEADVERYPLAERVKDQTALRRLAEVDADAFRVERDGLRSDLANAKVLIKALHARLDQLDAKRSGPSPSTPAKWDGIPPGWWYEAPPNTPFPAEVATDGRFCNAWPGGWATLVSSEHFAQIVVERGRRYLSVSEYDAAALDRARPAPGSVFGYESHDRTMRIGPLALDTTPDHRDAAQGIVLLRILNSEWALYATGPAPLDSEPVES